MPAGSENPIRSDAQDARAAMAHGEAGAPASLNALSARLLAAQARGALAARVREVVQENRAQAARGWGD